MTQGKITIKSEVSEQDLMENLLNMKASGFIDESLLIIISFNAMANSWNFDKLLYYLELLEIEPRSGCI